MLRTQPAHALRLEALLAKGRYLTNKFYNQEAQRTYREAATTVNRIAMVLNDTDRAALRVHPWSRKIRRGMR